MNARSRLARHLCDIGARMYQRGFCAANDGNLSARLGPNRVLCTPTFVSKGFMKPADLCVVDLTGRQLSGSRKRTSEILLHLALYRARPDVRAVVHCHAPHATAFAITNESLPVGVLAEAELFLGDVAIVPYETPGTPAFAALIEPHAHSACAAILKNHGVVTWADSLERAWWWAEILDSYCRILLLAKSLGTPTPIPDDKRRELWSLRKKLLEASAPAP